MKQFTSRSCTGQFHTGRCSSLCSVEQRQRGLIICMNETQFLKVGHQCFEHFTEQQSVFESLYSCMLLFFKYSFVSWGVVMPWRLAALKIHVMWWLSSFWIMFFCKEMFRRVLYRNVKQGLKMIKKQKQNTGIILVWVFFMCLMLNINY